MSRLVDWLIVAAVWLGSGFVVGVAFDKATRKASS